MSYKKEIKRIRSADFIEKDVLLPDKTVISYGESPSGNKNPPLLLIHGQTAAWQDYAVVLSKLAEDFHVFAVDCHGHGKSAHDPKKYSAKEMGKDFIWFIDNVIGSPAFVSGHSSGGLLTAWLAANTPQSVLGIVLEDPPFFSTEPGRWEKSFAYIDSCEPIHRFLNQSEESDWVLFYLRNAAWGKFVGAKGMGKMLDYGTKYRKKHPNKPLNFFFLPDSINRMFWFIDNYDLRFGEAFYDRTWFEEYDQTDTLSRIACPCVLIHTKWSVDENGILMAAMSGEDAAKAQNSISCSKMLHIDCGHNVHVEKPEEFISAIKMLVNKLI